MSVIMEGVLRAIFAFIVLLVLTRLLGKGRSQLTFFDYVTAATIGSMTATLAGNLTANIWGIFAALLTFVAFLILNSQLALESRPLRREKGYFNIGDVEFAILGTDGQLSVVTDMSDKEI